MARDPPPVAAGPESARRGILSQASQKIASLLHGYLLCFLRPDFSRRHFSRAPARGIDLNRRNYLVTNRERKKTFLLLLLTFQAPLMVAGKD